MSLPNSITRVATAVVAIPLVVYATYAGGWLFLGLVLAGGLLAQYELYGLLGRLGVRTLPVAGLAIGAVVGLRTEFPQAVPLAVGMSIVLAVGILLSSRFENPWQSFSSTVTAVFYPTVLLTYLVDLRVEALAALGEESAFWLTLSVFVLVWASDTVAYYVGRTLGRTPLAPEISPKKTWEGAVGGAIGAVMVALGLWKLSLVSVGWIDCVALGLICGTVGQLGDLAESRIKRAAGVKDSGTILPGHGGLLDRLDAMIIAVPMAYLYLAYVARVF
ncbi:MAG: phosphatidate cytidylyltransferase [Rhodothermales bacterium]|nr:phosphatidate cytidylyltransferase [Rhodothermales bacterium]